MAKRILRMSTAQSGKRPTHANRTYKDAYKGKRGRKR